MREVPLDADAARLRLFFSTNARVSDFDRSIAHCSQRPRFFFQREIGCGQRYRVARDYHMGSCIAQYGVKGPSGTFSAAQEMAMVRAAAAAKR